MIGEQLVGLVIISHLNDARTSHFSTWKISNSFMYQLHVATAALITFDTSEHFYLRLLVSVVLYLVAANDTERLVPSAANSAVVNTWPVGRR